MERRAKPAKAAKGRDLEKRLAEALKREAATSEILRVISSSPADVQPVFDTIVRSAVQLCGAAYGSVFRVDGAHVHHVAAYNMSSASFEQWQRSFPRPLDDAGGLREVLDTGSILDVPDVEQGPTFTGEARAMFRALRVRSTVAVPLARQGRVVGAIALMHRAVGGFSDAHITLLKTFADHALIAIENVRVFTELTTALEQQTATAEILKVISSSPTNVQPVFDTIADSASRLFGAWSVGVYRFDGTLVDVAAARGGLPDSAAYLRQRYPMRPAANTSSVVTRAIVDRALQHIPDIELHENSVARDVGRVRGYRATIAVPMMRSGEPIGAIAVTRVEPGPFSSAQVELLQTFADQAVIAIENARLLTELHARTAELTQSVEEMRALGEVGQAVSSTLDLDTVLPTIVARAVQLSGADGGAIYEYDEPAEEFALRATYNLADPDIALRREIRLKKGEGATGHLAVTRAPIQLPDITTEGVYDSRLRGALLRSGTRAVLAVPLLREEHLIGGLVISRNTPGEFPPDIVHLLQTFATQSALAIQNARLFREIEMKSRELEVASQHKSEFLASMSHELRTPLNAVIGFSDVLLQGMFGETNAKQTEYLRDILASGQHLLSLINDILDLTKIEAGKMELTLAQFDLPSAIDDALLLMRERADRRGIVLERHVDERLGPIRADQRKVKQVLLNLLSNAVKFTPEGGRIDVRARLVNGTTEISVTDTGIGIAAEDHEMVFEEFRQVGRADTKAEGTGLGLALSRKFVELHGGRISVTSELGEGSTFTFTLPVHRQD